MSVFFINLCSFKYLDDNTMRKQEDDNGKDQLEGRTSGWERQRDLFIYLFSASQTRNRIMKK